MNVYLSLPITGHDLAERIEYAGMQAAHLREIFGCDVFNPLAGVRTDEEHSYEYYMGRDLFALSECDMIVFCPGFMMSKGCMTEFWYARQMNIKMLQIDDSHRVWWDDDIYNMSDTPMIDRVIG